MESAVSNDLQQRKAYLLSCGWHIGPRDPRINTDYPGKFMVAEPHDESELPTRNGESGLWAIVGDDLESLINEAYECELHP
jgi:hypothetical protein